MKPVFRFKQLPETDNESAIEFAFPGALDKDGKAIAGSVWLSEEPGGRFVATISTETADVEVVIGKRASTPHQITNDSGQVSQEFATFLTLFVGIIAIGWPLARIIEALT